MFSNHPKTWLLSLLLPIIGCTSPAPRAEFDFGDVLNDGDGKSDIASHAKVLADVDLNSHVDGRFSNLRVYGFTFGGKAGGTINVNVAATAGASSSDTSAGDALDTVSAIYGPIDGKDHGPRLAYADDNVDGTNGQLPAVKLTQDGQYLIVLSTWNDPGQGPYTVNVGCHGTDFQCRRPPQNPKCDPTTRYIQGQQIVGTETWSQCKIVLLENTIVQKDAVLTVNPGVTVQGNYLGTDDYGSVALQIDGTLQAVGSPELPINFTALSKGWQGLILNGPSSTLKNVYIDKAKFGVAVHGSNNTFTDLNVSVTDTGIALWPESTGNTITRVKVSQTRDGISLSGDAVITDSILLGNGCVTDGCAAGSGVWGHQGSKRSKFYRTLISGFTHGMYLDTYELEVNDSTIINNRRGVLVTGPNAGVHPAYTCPAIPAALPQPPFHPSAPSSWSFYGCDPVFIRTDIIRNSEFAVKVQAPQLLVIEDSNIRDNGAGLIIETDSLAPDSHIVRSNIFNNGASAQVDSKHTNGVLDISGNYWAQISDPDLSASWNVSHSQAGLTCTATGNASSCAWTGSHYNCGVYVCDSSAKNCTTTTSTSWVGQLSFTGFSPVPLKAGPTTATCTDQVNAERQKQGA